MREINLDLDVDYHEFSNTREYRRLFNWQSRNGMAELIEYRKSASGRVHVRIVLKKEVDTLQAYRLRAYLGDDKTRIFLDLVRDFHGGETMRLWDFKSKGGRMRQAGIWKRLI